MQAAGRGAEWTAEVEVPLGPYTVCVVEPLELHLIPPDELMVKRVKEPLVGKSGSSATSLGTKDKTNLLRGDQFRPIAPPPPPPPQAMPEANRYCDVDYNSSVERLLRGRAPVHSNLTTCAYQTPPAGETSSEPSTTRAESAPKRSAGDVMSLMLQNFPWLTQQK
ncbi:hypothetical protein ADEAN_000928000 [Angomonas deanei]|uniref:Uncharacterized protein n=1 Tax=Angomonas deanei TaxID=59799 RepID=A0A7G2CQJ3_9TRYP|nr:hypothetical protein ADEAN_000928000 [Angomonas deanei]